MNQTLALRRNMRREPVSVAITAEHARLKEHQGRAPHGGRAAEPRQDDFRDQRLHQEQQARADDHGGGV